MISGPFVAAVDVNQPDIFGLSCLMNTCYDEKIYNRLIKKRIQRDTGPPYFLCKDDLTSRSGASVQGLIGLTN